MNGTIRLRPRVESEIRAEVAASALNEIGAKAMPPRTYRFSSLVARLITLSLASVALKVLRARRPGSRLRARRIAVSLSFATLFFAGAAFSAGAGDVMVQLVEDQATTAVAGSEEAEASGCGPRRSDWDAEDTAGCAPADAGAAPEAAAAAEPAPTGQPVREPPTEAELPSAAALVEETAEAEAVAEPATPSLAAAVRDEAQNAAPAPTASSRSSAPKAADTAPPVVEPEPHTHAHATAPDPEIAKPNTEATIWLHRALPDPTPPAKRLARRFARNLASASQRHRVDWALVLGVLRARGERGALPARRAGLNRLARNLARLGATRNRWSAVLALEGSTTFADRAVALARYHRAVGLKALVRGLEWAKPRLTRQLLRDEHVYIYPGGRSDLIAGRIDVRVIVLIRYLQVAHGQVSVTSLKSGHRFYSRPGVVSAHSYGQAVDIAALGGVSMLGNQLPGSITEEAVRNMLLLPAEVRPVQVISLLGLGGPSFPMANHDDHIHAGF
jgi:hypothetical protein